MLKKKVQPQIINDEQKEIIITLENEINQSKSCSTNTLVTINELLQNMTNLDYVKMMIDDATQQSELVNDVASGSEELSTSTEDISTHVQRANKTMSESVDITNQSLEKIDGTFLNFEENINQMNTVKNVMDEVTQETGKINEIVKVISDVASQTNLLALNASIEAARSGEHGRGFSVVAEEIKKLADNTKREVSLIQQIVTSLNEKIAKTSNEIDKVANALNNSKASMNEATLGMHGIKDAMRSVGDNFNEISANIEEQTAATQQMSSSLMIINEKSTKLLNETNKTGKAFYDISDHIDDIRIKTLSSIKELDSDTMIEITITDHLMWKWKVYNMILGYVQLEMDKLGDHNVCRLGKWLSTLNCSDTKVAELLKKIENPHAQIHKDAKNAVKAYDLKKIAESESILKNIEENSTIVVKYLKELKGVLALK